MTLDPRSPAAPTAEGASPSPQAMQALAEAITRLNGEGDFVARAITEFLLAQRPLRDEPALSQAERDYLVTAGAMTAEELLETSNRVAKGALQAGAVTALLANLHESMSASDAQGFLGVDDDELQHRVRNQYLYAVEVAGQQRFPSWQFSLGSPGKVLPHLSEIIAELRERSWVSVSGLMSTPQSALVSYGRQTPIEWFRGGGDFETFKSFLEARKWL